MRVIGGRSRGRRLAAKLPKSVRPTSDRVRESIFDILGSQGGVEGLRVIDLFSGSGALGAARFWCVDPLDGTKEFVAKNGEFCVCIGLVEDGWPVLGVVHGPARRITYAANGPGTAFRIRDGGAPETIARADRRPTASS